MNRLLLLLAISFFGSTLNAQTIKESYHPRKPFEHRTDTLINSNKISWIFRSTPDSYITQEYKDGDQHYKYYYRNSDLVVMLPSKNLTFNKMSFNELIDFDYESKFIWYRTNFEGFNSSTNELKFNISITKPETDWSYPINIFVNLNGTSRFELIEYDDDY